jgi:non-specific serine/threonine protein kinase
LRGAERTAWLDRLEREHDNLRSALAWFRAQGDAVCALRLAAALWQFWWWRSHFAEGRLRLAEVLAMPGAAAPTAERARALTGLGVLTETQGAVAEADVFHAESVEIWKGLGNASGLAYSLIFRWLIALNHDDQDGMIRFADESLELFRQVGDAWGIAMSHMELGIGAMRRYDPTAIELLSEARQRFREIKDAWGDAICTGVLGNVALTQGKVQQALPLLQQSLETLLELNDQWGVATFLPATARLEADLGRWERCVVLSGAVDALASAIGEPLKSPFLQRFKDNLSRASQALQPGMYDTAWAAGQSMSAVEAVAFAFALAPDDDKREIVLPSRPIAPAAAAGLTPREIEVLRLVDRTAKEIADALFVSPSTVITHLENIRGKLGLDSKNALSAYAAKHGYL